MHKSEAWYNLRLKGVSEIGSLRHWNAYCLKKDESSWQQLLVFRISPNMKGKKSPYAVGFITVPTRVSCNLSNCGMARALLSAWPSKRIWMPHSLKSRAN